MAPPKKIGLSKSRLLLGLQCPKSLYLSVHEPELGRKVSAAQQAVFDQGTAVGIEAQKYFAKGVVIQTDHRDQTQALKLTADAIKAGANTIFEATFESDGLLAKVDVLNRKNARAGWVLTEVKSSTSVKSVHLADVAIQTMVLQGAGLKVADSAVMHLNTECVAPELENLFTVSSVSDAVEPVLAALPEQLKNLRAMLLKPKAPDIDIGPHCTSPYPCPFMERCWAEKKMPSPSIFDFPKIGKKGWDFYALGVKALDDERFGPFKGTDLKRIEAARTGKRWVDAKEIRAAVAGWAWPLYFLDFETVAPAIPRYAGTSPYQQVPFQFSVCVQDSPGAPLREIAYLHDNANDPRGPLTEALVASFGPKGSIVAYNKGFEARVMNELAKLFPKHARKLSTAVDRLVDPLPVFRSFVYDAAFQGSFSIKSVAPALLGTQASYESLVVGDGQAAQIAFSEMVWGGAELPAERRAELRSALLEYCRKDTEELAGLVAWLFAQL